jgi:type III secretory pathway component EscR
MMKFASPEHLLVISLVLAVIPLMVVTATCYLKCSVVLSLLRGGFGTQQAPSNSMVMALSLVVSIAVMEPVGREVYGLVSTLRPQELARMPIATLAEQVGKVLEPWARFLHKHCGERELRVFSEKLDGETVVDLKRDESPSKVGPIQLLGAFVLSEIRRGFVAAFILLIPFFVVDIVVANVLVGLGLTMMSPVVVSLPLKLLLFITCDGWLLLAQGFMRSYN